MLELLLQIFWFDKSKKAQKQKSCTHTWKLIWWGGWYKHWYNFLSIGNYFKYHCEKCDKWKKEYMKNTFGYDN